MAGALQLKAVIEKIKGLGAPQLDIAGYGAFRFVWPR